MKKRTFYIILFLTLIALILYNLFIMYKNIDVTEDYTAKKTSVSDKNEQNVTNIADMIEEVTKSVCGISKLSTAGGTILSTATADQLGLGTGIIVSSNGYILSNSHVTGEKYSTCYVKLEDNETTYRGTVVWADKELDLSITKINAKDLKYANLGISKNSRVGESVYAIGNPIGYEFRRTVTSGIISAINRTVKLDENGETTYMSDLLQTDATINPGNSGGPLINNQGKVIGINSVKITSAEGIGFSIPVDVIKPVIKSFSENGTFEEANLGIYVYDEFVAKYLDLKNKFTKGIYIAQISANGPTYGKGLKEGEIITKIDDEILYTVNDLKEYIYSKKPGDIVSLTIDNGRTTKIVNIELDKK